ncbi:serine hydrolase [Kordiimonas sp. SCSIO 12603]|uniref:beta-lactamase family protein n=1 Tax=Kordiimonas sp. SCSIO 12603 TaxID=2829596 RepID=UPI0021075F30|nr:beta-lactamase family protein [Kordiimonas sp. SCSIO 12603]UTW59388.1 serine hydrolase [Kordiimonas sp. SCSIO 12603]
MKRFKHIACSLMLIAGFSAQAHSQDTTDKNTAFIEGAEAIIQGYTESGWFTGTVAIYKDDQIIFDKSYGLADIENNIANQSNTKIRIGSINKHITAAILLRMVQDGKLTLEDTLAKFDLGFPAEVANKITVRQLLSHRSGFADIFNDEYYRTYKSLKNIQDKLPLLMDKPLLSEPGTKREYSNYNYIVLGAIIEKISGQDFASVLKQEILSKIGANDTEYALTEDVTGKALSYSTTMTGKKVDRTAMLENVTPDGGMYSTPSDLARFYSHLFYENTILNDEMKAVLGNHYQKRDRKWEEIKANPDNIWSSYGGGPGVSAAVEVLFKDKLFIIVLANTDQLVAERISQRIADLHQGKTPEPALLPLGFFAYLYIEKNGIEAFSEKFETAIKEAGYKDYSDRWLNHLGFILWDEGEQDMSLAVLKKNVELFPTVANAFDSLGLIYERLGNKDAAIANYRKTLELDESFTSAKEGIERLSAS